MNLEIETLSSLGHDSIGMKVQHWSYHPCGVDISYLAWISFSKCDLLPCDATNVMQCYARQEFKYECMLYDKQNALQEFKSILSNLNPWQASSWWTILHAMSETKTTGSCKTHVYHYLDKVRQALSIYIWNASIWQGNYMTLEASNTLSSLRNLQKVLSSSGFVKISANWSSEWTPQSDISVLATWSLRKWWRISMYFVRDWWTGLLAIFTALSLSQRSGILSNTTP